MKKFLTLSMFAMLMSPVAFGECQADAPLSQGTFAITGMGAVATTDTVLNSLASQSCTDSVLATITTNILSKCEVYVKTLAPTAATLNKNYAGILSNSMTVIGNCGANALLISYLAEVGKSIGGGDSSDIVKGHIAAVQAMLAAMQKDPSTGIALSAGQISAKLNPALMHVINTLQAPSN